MKGRRRAHQPIAAAVWATSTPEAHTQYTKTEEREKTGGDSGNEPTGLGGVWSE